jgi:AcrR family transcriptional regulator
VNIHKHGGIYMAAHQTTMVRRTQIAEAAGKLISKHSSENLTIKSIAAEVGISEAAIYRHFHSKKDVLILLADHVRETLVNDIDAEAFSEANPLAALEIALNKHLSAIERRHGISFQVISEIVSLGDKDLNKRASEALERYAAKLADILEQARKQGAVRAGLDTAATALLISVSIQGLVNTWVLSNYSIDIRAEFNNMWKILLEGITG